MADQEHTDVPNADVEVERNGDNVAEEKDENANPGDKRGKRGLSRKEFM
jgi:hypothetical protein